VLAALALTWIGWECAVNLAMAIEAKWLKPLAMSGVFKTLIGGFVAGAVGAFLTWAGVAASQPALRRSRAGAGLALLGAVLGLLLAAATHFDMPSLLFVPWQALVAAAFGYRFAAARRLAAPG
jgi:hypothetical protein